jgi:hypothetical protein
MEINTYTHYTYKHTYVHSYMQANRHTYIEAYIHKYVDKYMHTLCIQTYMYAPHPTLKLFIEVAGVQRILNCDSMNYARIWKMFQQYSASFF